MPDLTVARIVAVLKKVPEKRFRIMDLAPQLVDEKGNVDIVKIIDQQGELNLAIVEVESYIKATRAARDALGHIDGRQVKPGEAYFEEEEIVIPEDEE
jgi:hypothetical protein